jgi:hypothetical protein
MAESFIILPSGILCIPPLAIIFAFIIIESVL